MESQGQGNYRGRLVALVCHGHDPSRRPGHPLYSRHTPPSWAVPLVLGPLSPRSLPAPGWTP